MFPHWIISGRLPYASSVFSGDLLAILPAIAHILRLLETEFVIYSDSQSSLRSISNPFCHHPLVREIHRWLRILSDRGKTVHFCWVSGYVGIADYEKVDLEAVAAATTHNCIAPTRLHTRDYYSHFSPVHCFDVSGSQSKILFLLGVTPVDRIGSMRSFCHGYSLDGWRTNICYEVI